LSNAAIIDRDEWMEIWNSNQELQKRTEILELRLFKLGELLQNIEDRLDNLEEKNKDMTTTIYGKEVKSK
jgi:chaperonin cofactor prefoldin